MAMSLVLCTSLSSRETRNLGFFFFKEREERRRQEGMKRSRKPPTPLVNDYGPPPPRTFKTYGAKNYRTHIDKPTGRP